MQNVWCFLDEPSPDGAPPRYEAPSTLGQAAYELSSSTSTLVVQVKQERINGLETSQTKLQTALAKQARLVQALQASRSRVKDVKRQLPCRSPRQRVPPPVQGKLQTLPKVKAVPKATVRKQSPWETAANRYARA